MRYVDGFVIPISKRKIASYRRIARIGAKVWLDHGALEYRECVGDDRFVPMATTFHRQLRLKPGETIVFAWIVYRSRAHREQVNARVMKDPRIQLPPEAMPFDMKRMLVGGFTVLVDHPAKPANRRSPKRRK